MDVTFIRKLTHRLQEELFAFEEAEALLGELPPELVEQREKTQNQLDAIDRALVAAAQKDERADA